MNNTRRIKQPSQTDRIKAELMLGRKLTSLEIINELKILNYKGRIWDLRKSGLSITTKMVPTSGGSEIAQYYMADKQTSLNF